MKNIELTKYEVPEVDVIEVNVENGYALSPDIGNLEDPEPGSDTTFP